MDAVQTTGHIEKDWKWHCNRPDCSMNAELSGWKNYLAKEKKTKNTSTWQDWNFQYQHTLSYLSVPRRQIQFNSAEADLMSGDVLGWSSRNLAIWKLILCLKCSVVCRSGEVYHNTLRLGAQAAFSGSFYKDSKELQLIESDWLGVIMFSSEATLHDIAPCQLLLLGGLFWSASPSMLFLSFLEIFFTHLELNKLMSFCNRRLVNKMTLN